MTWNVNAFVGEKNWAKLKKGELPKIQEKYFEPIIGYIEKKLNEENGVDIIVLEEFPFKKWHKNHDWVNFENKWKCH